VAGLCERGNEPSGSMKCGALLGCCVSTVCCVELNGWLVGWLVSESASWSVSQAGRHAVS
jgi:hypothetical protein